MLNVIHIGRYPSPVGLINLAASEAGILSLDFNSTAVLFKRALKASLGPGIRLDLNDTSRFSKVFKLFDRYFSAKKVSFDSVKIDLGGTPFEISVWRNLRKIPTGKTRTYLELAQEVGSPNGARAVGGACAKNPVPLIIPCHRVISSNGSIGGYSAGLVGRGLSSVELKRALLDLEGLEF